MGKISLRNLLSVWICVNPDNVNITIIDKNIFVNITILDKNIFVNITILDKNIFHLSKNESFGKHTAESNSNFEARSAIDEIL